MRTYGWNNKAVIYNFFDDRLLILRICIVRVSMMKDKKTKDLAKNTISQTIKDAGFGWLGTIADLSLVTLVLGVAGMGANPRNAEKIVEQAGKLFISLRQKRLQKSLRSSLYHLSELGWRKEWGITNEGFKRLKELVPIYRENRLWDGWLYLVIYDIPENLRRSREKLRIRLQELKFGILQESAWVSLENPQALLDKVIEWNELEDYVLILKTKLVGKNRLNVIPVLTKAFRLDLFNLQYKSFLTLVEAGKTETAELALRFLNILKTDPQLPQRLLPKDWLGNKAYKIYRNKILPKMPHEYGEFIEELMDS